MTKSSKDWRDECHLDLIIRAWYNEAIKTDDQGEFVENPITRFAFLWFSFNAYYSETLVEMIRYNERNNIHENGRIKHPSEISAIVRSMNRFSFKMADWSSCQGFIYFKSRKKIKDMYCNENKDSFGYGNGPFDEESGKNLGGDINHLYSDKERLKGYLNILYTVRCNLFHGQKRLFSDEDLEIIENACLCLSVIVSALLD